MTQNKKATGVIRVVAAALSVSVISVAVPIMARTGTPAAGALVATNCGPPPGCPGGVEEKLFHHDGAVQWIGAEQTAVDIVLPTTIDTSGSKSATVYAFNNTADSILTCRMIAITTSGTKTFGAPASGGGGLGGTLNLGSVTVGAGGTLAIRCTLPRELGRNGAGIWSYSYSS